MNVWIDVIAIVPELCSEECQAPVSDHCFNVIIAVDPLSSLTRHELTVAMSCYTIEDVMTGVALAARMHKELPLRLA